MYRVIIVDRDIVQYSVAFKEYEYALIEYLTYLKINSTCKLYIIEYKNRYFKIIKSNV